MEKNARIIEILNWLKDWLGDQFVISDKWEADRSAIGVASPNDSQQIVYISTLKTPRGLYNVALETAPRTDSDQPFESIGEFKKVNREELLRLTVQHLRISVQSPTSPESGVWFRTARMRHQIRSKGKPKKKMNAKEKRALKAADLQLFTQEYGRKAQRGKEPNDRQYSRDVEKKAKRLKPEKFDKLLRDGDGDDEE